jgi:hypothetical protein
MWLKARLMDNDIVPFSCMYSENEMHQSNRMLQGGGAQVSEWARRREGRVCGEGRGRDIHAEHECEYKTLACGIANLNIGDSDVARP